MSKGQYNIYDCEDGHQTVTVDVDDGTTPFAMGCKHEGCTQIARSRFYNVPYCAALMVSCKWEWYKPSRKKAKRMGAEMLSHVERGGLALRRSS